MQANVILFLAAILFSKHLLMLPRVKWNWGNSLETSFTLRVKFWLPCPIFYYTDLKAKILGA